LKTEDSDLADALPFATNHRHGCDYTITLDRKAAAMAGGRALE